MNILFYLAGITAIFLLGLTAGAALSGHIDQKFGEPCGDYLAEGEPN